MELLLTIAIMFMLEECRVFLVVSVDCVFNIAQKYEFILEKDSCLNPTHSYVTEETTKFLQLNLLKLLQVGHDIGPDAVGVADYSTVGFCGSHQFFFN